MMDAFDSEAFYDALADCYVWADVNSTPRDGGPRFAPRTRDRTKSCCLSPILGRVHAAWAEENPSVTKYSQIHGTTMSYNITTILFGLCLLLGEITEISFFRCPLTP